ncbi:sensor histidine kinase [Bdellovibrio reynosensis]|uniref:histidine kinase n=1 Tax=Bdellovibrio reynosensis TaxID=2835041 RepID=A0ABY4CAW8_9BACT|nr:HAMP domain-containing sensor histidine kinase [Bdellovibrio reynosensis]UOF00826.1 HAMP domain-containing histidine kinase [Bdellovibrio reynosensis]
MEHGQQNSTSAGVNDLKYRLRRLWVFFAVFQVLSLIAILTAIEFATYRNKKSLAYSLTDSLSNSLLVKDYRRITEALSTPSKNEFNKIFLQDFSNGKDITLGNESQIYFQHKITVPIYFDSERRIKIAHATYSYKLFSLILEVLFVWCILLLISSVWLYQFRKNTIKAYEQEIETKLAREMAEMARRVAHDIRSPLSALNMLVGSSQEIAGEPKTIIKQVSQRINDIADDLLSHTKKRNSHDEFLKAESHPIARPVSTYKIIPALKSLVVEKQLEFKGHEKVNISLRLNSLPDELEIGVPEKILLRIISNLINNSIEAIVDDGSLFIETQQRNNNLIISVIDFGKGIPPDILEKFRNKEFASFGKSDSQKSGSGIGLKSAYEQIEDAGGKMSIDSKLDIGTRVSIEIPVKSC